jgi:hypothetical protein
MPIKSEDNTGPYRRVLSKLGFAYESAKIFLPDTSAISTFDDSGQIKESGDTVFVYLGGAGAKGGEIDAGFQFSQKNNNWSLIMRVVGFPDAVAHVIEDGIKKVAPRFRANQTVLLEFEVTDPDVVEVRATGDLVNGETGVTQKIRLDISQFPDTTRNQELGRVGDDTEFGWNPTGGKNRLKRVTSIAQRESDEVIESGSSVKGVVWSNCKIGTTRAAASAWSQDSFLKERSENLVTHPNKTIIQVSFLDQSNETVSIIL